MFQNISVVTKVPEKLLSLTMNVWKNLKFVVRDTVSEYLKDQRRPGLIIINFDGRPDSLLRSLRDAICLYR